MEALKGASLYLSGPIEFEDGPNWRPEVVKTLTERFGLEVYDPHQDEKQKRADVLEKAIDKGDFDTVEQIAKDFVKKDLATLEKKDFLIAYNPYKIPTTGTPCEVHHAVNLKKPVMIVCPQGKSFASRWYFGYVKHRYIFGSWDALYDYLQEVADGKHKDNHRWHLVYGMV